MKSHSQNKWPHTRLHSLSRSDGAKGGVESQSPSETQPSQCQVAEQVPGRHVKWQEENRAWLNILNPNTADTELKTFDFKNNPTL